MIQLLRFSAALLMLPALAQQPAGSAHLSDSELETIDRAIARGQEWLVKHQNAEGAFAPVKRRDACHVAITAMAVWALANSDPAEPVQAMRGVDFLLRYRQEDGGIYDPKRGLRVYTSGVAAAGFRAWLGARSVERIAQALPAVELFAYRNDVPESLVDVEERSGTGSRVARDQALELLKKDDLTPAQRAALEFIAGCSEDDARRPVRTREPHWKPAGAGTSGLSYEDVLPLIYQPIKREHQRAQRAFKAIRDHYTVDRNPDLTQRYGPQGFQRPRQGIYYYYLIMAKTLAAYGSPLVDTTAGERHDWVRELSSRILRTQLPSGYWTNENGSWWEDEPVLVTSYALIALRYCRDMQAVPGSR